MDPTNFADAQRFLLAHAARLRAYLHMLLGNVHDAEDALQETFVKYLRSGPAVSDHAERWLFAVCRNEALDLRRDRRRRVAREQAAGGQAARDADANETDPAALADRRDSMDHMTRCLARLPEELREMVYLKFAEELSMSEIAERLHMPRSTVALRVQQGMAMLDREFHGGDHD
jgi:RNA polymerase sigma-70 factor (ECF subfamily)